MPLPVLQRLLHDSDIPPARARVFFKKADLNRDERVNYDEFLRQVSRFLTHTYLVFSFILPHMFGITDYV